MFPADAYACVPVHHGPITRLVTPDHLLPPSPPTRYARIPFSPTKFLGFARHREQFIAGEFAVYPRGPSIIDLLLTVSPGAGDRVLERETTRKEEEREHRSDREGERERNALVPIGGGRKRERKLPTAAKASEEAKGEREMGDGGKNRKKL